MDVHLFVQVFPPTLVGSKDVSVLLLGLPPCSLAPGEKGAWIWV